MGAPRLGILSHHPERFAAFRSLWPLATDAHDLSLVDATDGLPALPDHPCLILAPARPGALPPQARWLASPARAETIAAALGQLWRDRTRHFHAAVLQLDPPLFRVPGQEALPLTEKEARLLAALIDHPEGLPRTELLAQWWGMSEELDTHALETQFYRLRQKLRPLLGDGLELSLNKGLCRLHLA